MIDVLKFGRQLFQCLRRNFRDLLDAILVAQQVQYLLVENLPGKLPRLGENDATILRVGIVSEIGAFIYEAFAIGIDHDAERVAVFLEIIANRQIAESRRITLPSDSVAARPITRRLRAGVERHANAVTGVEACTAHLGEIPTWTKIARTPLRVGLKAPGSQDDGLRLHSLCLATMAHADAGDAAAVILFQRHSARLVGDRNAILARRRRERIDQTRTASPSFDCQPAPELEPAIDLERLSTIDRLETHAFSTHPTHRFAAAPDQNFSQLRISAIFGNAGHIVEKLLLGI